MRATDPGDSARIELLLAENEKEASLRLSSSLVHSSCISF
jgi:hypothetical protein